MSLFSPPNAKIGFSGIAGRLVSNLNFSTFAV
jgi:hypothetical protein